MIRAANARELLKIIADVCHACRGRARIEELRIMMGTAATESGYRSREQIGGGPAVGLFGIEPKTGLDTFRTYLLRKEWLYSRLMGTVFGMASAPFFIPEHEEIVRLLRDYDDYSAFIARVKYLRVPKRIPIDLESIALYYKVHYNTEQGAGSVEKFLRDYHDYKCEGLIQDFLGR